MSFAKLLDDTTRRVPNKVVLIDGGHRWSYAAFDLMTQRVAAGLAAASVRPGERIALHMLNCAELAVLFFACARLGAIAVPVNTRLKPAEIDFVLRHSGATVYIGDSTVAPPAMQSPRCGSPVRQVFLLGDAAGAHPYDELLPDRPVMSLPEVGPEQPATIMYTSGSTARPKGVVHSHRAVIAGAELGQPGITSDAVVAQATSMVHAGGFSNLIAAVHAGATFVLVQSFDAARVLHAIEAHRCTYFAGLPFMFEELVHRQSVGPRDVMSATTFHGGGDSVSPALQQRFLAVFHHPLREGYGSTEAGRVTHQPPDRPVRTGSIGVPIDGIRVKVADPDGHEVAQGAAGELMIRSPAMMSGYWQDPDASAASLQKGWLRSSDLVRQDADGYLWFLGRIKEVIVRGGSNIAPCEIEHLLAEHPAVAESVALGLPDAVLGERVVAVVRARPGMPVAERELIAFLRKRLADYKVPERIWFRTTLLQNAGGKLQRGLLRERLLSDLVDEA